MVSSILLILLCVIRPTLQLESNTFLIYNENHEKCLQAQQDTIIVAKCNADNDGQKFRWISKYQLINVKLPQCLGVSSKSEMSVVSLSSCDGASELQKWECKNDTLFGIQGEDLYLNYGNAKEKVIIHKQSKDWSRWKIYGTPDDLCAKAYDDIYSLFGNDRGQPCVFPFKYHSKWYADCTVEGSKNGNPWCATTKDYDKDELWGYCPVKAANDSGWSTDSITGSKYQVFEKAALTWYQARRSCHQQDAELLSVTELHEQTFILGKSQTTDAALWIGLNSLDMTEGWKWNDGSPFRYLNWLPGNPSPNHGKNCASMSPKNNGKWENEECSKRLGYVCKKGNITSYNAPSGTEPINCPVNWIPYAGYCYLLHTEPKMWQEAKTLCRAEAGDLASLHNVEESSFANSNFEFEEAGLVWLGLNDLKTQMFFEWSDGTPVTYTAWQRGEPSHYNNRQEDCVALNTTLGLWSDKTCDEKFPFICKRKPLPFDHERGPIVEQGCSTGWKRHGPYCYYVGETISTFSEANSSCNSHAAFLMTVGDRFEQAYLTSLIGLRPEKYFWTGLSDLEERGTFTWTTSDMVLYTHWDADMPGRKQGCVVMRTGNKGGLWDVINCDEKAKFVCKKLAEGATAPPIPKPTTAPKCPPDWTTKDGMHSCFRFYQKPKGEKKSWFEARDFCQAIGGDLLSINNKDDEKVVAAMLKRNHYNQVWMGLRNSDPDKGYEWSDNSPLVYENWQYGKPNNYQGNGLCGEIIAIIYLLTWNDRNCENLKDWICEIKKGATLLPEPTSSPNSGFNLTADGWLVNGDKQYYVADDKVSMDKARAFCRSNSGDLVTIHDEEERKFLWRFIQTNRTQPSYYIGLRLSVDKQFIWMDGSPVDYVAWSVNEPNFSNNDENCVELYKDLGRWNDVNCGTLTSYICERETKNINTTFPPTPPVPQGGCPAEWLEFKGKCYRIFGKEEDSLVDWHTGRSACHNLKANLASIHDDLTQAFLTYKLRDFKNPVWIGLNDINWNRKYRWTDQSGMYYTKWAKGHPSTGYYVSEEIRPDCVAMKVGEVKDAGSWTEEICKQEKGYICQKPSDPDLPIRTTLTPELYEFGDASYKFQKTKMKWDEARKMCKESDYDLASIEGDYTNSFITVQLDTFKEPMWIGLLSNNMTGNQYKWSDGWRLRYTKWAPEEPKEKSSCVYIDVNGQWKTASCDENYASICKQSSGMIPTEPPQKPGKCPESSSINWIPFRGHCYFMQSVQSYEWGEASVKCLQQGGNLVSIEDQLEADFLSQYVEFLSDRRTYFWIGLFKNVKGEWLWMDNTPVDYINWNDGEPTDQGSDVCIVMDARKGTWVSKMCYYDMGYICKAQKIPESPVNTTEPEKSHVVQNKPTRGMAAGVAILVIVVIAGTVIVVFLLYRKRKSSVPPIENNFENKLYSTSNHADTSQDTNILVNDMEQL